MCRMHRSVNPRSVQSVGNVQERQIHADRKCLVILGWKGPGRAVRVGGGRHDGTG